MTKKEVATPQKLSETKSFSIFPVWPLQEA